MNNRYKSTIDKFGRVVIPKRIRNNLGLYPNVELDIVEDMESITIHPISEEPFIVNKGGVLVVRAKLTESVEDFIGKDRRDRVKHILKGL
ncbi:MAG: AbrB/MazE/SpoVT family DNA-binding domain-containing protein [Actinobacteria bacterium]|nr:AbrB/MazE/SpoVT family DNA-binding domain-containing protein [Actinomycetota bacterium]